MNQFKKLLVGVACMAILTYCGSEEDEPLIIELPEISTSSVSNITQTSASSGGNVTSDGNDEVTARGIVWSTNSSPTVSLATKTSNGSGKGSFSSSITGLDPETTYFVRAYATNSKGTAYGNQVSFTTEAIPVVLPAVTTNSISNVLTKTASVSGNVSSDGNGTISARGIVWSTSINPTTSLSTKTSESGTTGSFTSQLTGLSPNTTYHVRAFATNSAGTAYGDDKTFTTLPLNAPTISTNDATEIKEHTAKIGGNVSSDGNGTITKRGVIWKYANPSDEELTLSNNDGLVDNANNTEGSFTEEINVGVPDALIRYRSYATNEVGTTYGDIKSFRTLPLPVINLYSTTKGYSLLKWTVYSSDFKGRLSETIEVGIVYSTTENPTISTGTKLVYPSGYYGYVWDLTANNLKDDTKYYYRMFITTINGTFYTYSGNLTTKVINGYNVKSVRYDNSSTNPQGYIQNTSGTSWTMRQPNNTYLYFTEYNRDDWSVYMTQNGTTFNVQIDLYQDRLYYWNTGDTSKTSWYAVWEWYTNSNFTSD